MSGPAPSDDHADRATRARTRHQWVRSSEYTPDDWAAVADMVERAEARGLLRRRDPS